MNEINKIDSFRGKYNFLSNFYTANVTLDGKRYQTVEHAYQAAKTLDENQRGYIWSLLHPAAAKKAGYKVTLRSDWENIKVDIMKDLVRQKFQSAFVKRMLLNTGDAELIEGNDWNDTFWGVCKGVGQNQLGKILMGVREELKEQAK